MSEQDKQEEQGKQANLCPTPVSTKLLDCAQEMRSVALAHFQDAAVCVRKYQYRAANVALGECIAAYRGMLRVLDIQLSDRGPVEDNTHGDALRKLIDLQNACGTAAHSVTCVDSAVSRATSVRWPPMETAK